MTPDRIRAAERELIATMLRDHADARVNDAPAYAEAIYDAEALVRGGRPVYAPGPTADSAAAEVRQLRAVIEGRRAPPTDDELVAHRAAGGSWRIVTDSLLIGCADRQPDYNVRIIVDGLARLRRPVRVRWWALDAGHCVCPWPSVRATSD